MALTTCVLVGESQEWLDEIIEKVKKLKVGAGVDQGVDLGPLCYPEVIKLKPPSFSMDIILLSLLN